MTATIMAARKPQTLIEKIVQRHVLSAPHGHPVTSPVYQGDLVYLQPAHVMTHDNTMAVLGKFRAWGCTQMARPTQPVFTLDHNVQDKSPENLARYAAIEAFAKKHGVRFYPAGRGIGHQVLTQSLRSAPFY